MTSPPAENWAPRRMLPPPTTIASCTPRSTIRLAWRATDRVSSMEMPDLLACPNPSPLSLRTTRLYLGLSASGKAVSSMAQAPGEAGGLHQWYRERARGRTARRSLDRGRPGATGGGGGGVRLPPEDADAVHRAGEVLDRRPTTVVAVLGVQREAAAA